MRRVRAFCRVVSALFGTLVVLVTAAVSAQQAGLPAVVSTGGSGLEAATVAAAIERELGVPLVSDAGAKEHLEVTLTGRRANVTYYAQGREPVTRSVDLPRDQQRALDTIAFLAGNLARDEASELLKQLAPPPDGSEPDSVPRSEAVPPPPPPPAAEQPPAKPAKPAPSAAKPAAPALIEPHPFAANISLFYPHSILEHTERRRLNLELTLGYSRIGALRGAAVGFGYLDIEGPVDGYSGALLWNRSGPVTGLQTALFVNEGHGTLEGVSLANFVDFRDGDIHGLQGSGIFVKAEDIHGLQGATFVSIARDVHGVQGAAVTSLARDVHGVQGAAVTSIARDVHGVQAGIVSVARRVNGVQIGLVNVADEIHGGALGFVSVAKNGRLQPTVWLPGPGAALTAGLKSVTDLTYSLIGMGYDPFGERLRHEESVGLHLDLGHHFYGETGIGYGETYRAGPNDSPFSNASLVRSELRYDARVGFEAVHGLTPFVGGTFTRRIQGQGADFRGEYCFGVSLL